MLRTESYIGNEIEEVKVGNLYNVGQIWDGEGELETDPWELKGHVFYMAMYDEDEDEWNTVELEVQAYDCNNPMDSIVKVLSI